MNQPYPLQCTAFEGFCRVASGDLPSVVAQAKPVVDEAGHVSVLIFDDATARIVEVDFRGTAREVQRRLAHDMQRWAELAARDKPASESATEQDPPVRGVGRPKLGVVAREVTLLPRHWEWLGSQPGGASVALRKLVDQARRANEGRDRVRQAQEVANRFMVSVGGDLPGFEEATRALFAGHQDRFNEQLEAWPADVRDYAKKLAAPVFEASQDFSAVS